jgi:hypothetical protein
MKLPDDLDARLRHEADSGHSDISVRIEEILRTLGEVTQLARLDNRHFVAVHPAHIDAFEYSRDYPQ